MSTYVYPYRPTIVIGLVNEGFSDCGIDAENTLKIIKIGENFESFDPNEQISSIMGFEKDQAYFFFAKKTIDLTGKAINTVPDDLETTPGINVFAGKAFAGIALQTVDFTTVGFSSANLMIIYKVGDPYESFDPNEAASAITGFEVNEAYYGIALADMDLSEYLIPPIVVTTDIEQETDPYQYYGTEATSDKGYYNIPVRFVDDEASLPATGIENIEYIAKSEGTSWYWDGADYVQLSGGGAADGNNYPTSLTFDTDTGDLTIERVGLTDLVENLDGRYALVNNTLDDLISGGIVTWEGGLDFTMSEAVAYIDGVIVEGVEQSLTLDAADPTNPRFDVLVLDDTGTFTKITGVAAADPSEPQIDPSTQLYLTTVLVGAGATTPTGVSTVIVYDENTEWTASSAGTVSVNFNNTTNPSNGTKSAAVASWSSGATLVFTNSTTVNTGDVNSFSLRVWLTANLSKSQNLSIQFFNGATAVSLQQPIAISKTTTGAYQTFSLAEIDWTGAVFDRVKILLGGNNSNVLYIDEIRYQTGISQPSGTEIDPTVHPLIKAIPTSIDATTNKYLNWNGSAYVKKQVAYSEVSGTPTLADVATSGDYNDLDNLPTPYTDADARAAISLTTTGTSGAATYDDSTGVLNIPQYSGGGAETDPLSVHLTGTSTATGDMTLDLGTTNELIITGNQNAANILTVNNTNAGSTAIGISASVSGGSNAVKAVSTGGQAISGTGATGVIGTGTSFGCYGSSTSGTSLYGFTSSGTALMGFASSSGTPCKLSASPSSTNTVASLLHIIRTSSGTAANGIGGSINFYNEASDAASYESANIASTWTDVTAASRTGDLKIYTTNSATSGLRMTITGAGRVIIASIPTYADNAAAVSAGEATGTLYYRTGHGLDIVT
jgi:hypothetical protein